MRGTGRAKKQKIDLLLILAKVRGESGKKARAQTTSYAVQDGLKGIHRKSNTVTLLKMSNKRNKFCNCEIVIFHRVMRKKSNLTSSIGYL